MRLYLFGPMRGYKDENREAFTEAREKLRDMKHEVFDPWEMTETLMEAKQPVGLRELLRIDLNWICSYAEGLVGLPGWSTSKGSLAEVHLAWAIGLPVYEYEMFSRRVIREIKAVPTLDQ